MKKILVAGDVCDDVYLFSSVQKKNPEHSSPIYSIEKRIVKPGMAANVEKNLENMEVESDLFDNSVKHIQKTRLYYNDQYITRIDHDEFMPFYEEGRKLEFFKVTLKDHDAIIVSDYGKGFWNKETLDTLKKTDKLIFIDPYSTTALRAYPPCFCITPNYEEGKALTGEFSYPKICEYIVNNLNTQYVVLKVGEKGSYLYKKGWDYPINFPAIQTECVDPCGAGDTFIAALAAHYTQHKNITDAVAVANRAASLTVGHIGVYSPTSEEWKKITLDK